MAPDDVVSFWHEAGPDRWFKKDEAFDARIRERFARLYDAAARGELDGWADTPEGLLALVLVLDQFSRNLFRDDARAFRHDDRALALAHAAHERGWVERLLEREDTAPVAVFAIMPLMHSEGIADQELCVRLMLRPRWADNFGFAVVHRDVIRRFGRFPHRNPVLGRHTTPAERAFLDGGGFGG